jgi:hypothetical protein
VVHITEEGEAVLQPVGDVAPVTLNTNAKELGAINKVIFSRDGGSLLAASQNFVHLFNVDQPQISSTFRIDGQQAMAVHPNGTMMALGRPYVNGGRMEPGDGIRLMNANGQETNRLVGHEFIAEALAFSPNGQTLASADAGDRELGRPSSVYLWTGNQNTTLQGPQDYIFHLTFSGTGDLLAAAGQDGTRRQGVVRIWDLPGGQREATLRTTVTDHDSPVISVAFSPNGAMLASGDVNGSVLLSHVGRVQPPPPPPEMPTQRVILAIRDAELPNPAVLNADISVGALVSQDGGRTFVLQPVRAVPRTIAPGIYEVILPFGNYGVTVSAKDYVSASMSIEVGDRVVDEELLLQRVPTPAYPVVLIVMDEKAKPVTNVQITIPGIPLEPETKVPGFYRFELEPGVYEVTIGGQGYESTTRKIPVGTGPFEMKVQLRMATSPTYPVSLTVRDEKQQPVAGASVRIAGVSAGPKSSRRGVYQFNLASGDYEFIVKMKGYESVNKSFRVRDEPFDAVIGLIAEPSPIYTILLAVQTEKQTPIEQATVEVVGVDVSPFSKAGGVFEYRLESGTYRFRVSSKGYEPAEKIIRLTEESLVTSFS